MDKPNYFLMNPFEKFFYKTGKAIKRFPGAFVHFFVAIGLGIGRFFKGIAGGIKNYFVNFAKGNAATKGSYVIMGLGHAARGQVAKGLVYLLIEISFVLYMVMFGAPYLGKFFYGFFSKGTVGITETHDFWNDDLGIYEKVVGDNSFKIILYGILTIFMIIFFLAIYLRSLKESRELEEMAKDGKRAVTFRKEAAQLMDTKFHITLLSLPMLGLFVFTVVPLVTMIIIAFTNYDASTEVPQHLFRWVGFENFGAIFGENSTLNGTFLRVLGWTLIWAFFATFSNYFGGMIVALLINKKGIKCKKLFRTVFVMTIAVPQFVSLMIVSKMLTAGDSMEMSGILTQLLYKIFGFQLKFGINITHTRIAIILVNMWIGIPYSMLICSGILMNIPADLYESARIDGAGPVKTFMKITLPYMLFVTGPYLITTFIGNINNFNVIFLLSGGGPGDLLKYSDGAKGTDLLITWLYKLSLGTDRNYKLASVIGILVFIISATFSLMVYNRSSAVKKEDQFQ